MFPAHQPKGNLTQYLGDAIRLTIFYIKKKESQTEGT